MSEMVSIMIVTVVMFAGLWALGWVYGDHKNKPQSDEDVKPSS